MRKMKLSRYHAFIPFTINERIINTEKTCYEETHGPPTNRKIPWYVIKHKGQTWRLSRQYGTGLNIFKLWKMSFTITVRQYACGMHRLFAYTVNASAVIVSDFSTVYSHLHAFGLRNYVFKWPSYLHAVLLHTRASLRTQASFRLTLESAMLK
jgi:hypothetical protein